MVCRENIFNHQAAQYLKNLMRRVQFGLVWKVLCGGHSLEMLEDYTIYAL